jgi:hypothetical protein
MLDMTSDFRPTTPCHRSQCLICDHCAAAGPCVIRLRVRHLDLGATLFWPKAEVSQREPNAWARGWRGALQTLLYRLPRRTMPLHHSLMSLIPVLYLDYGPCSWPGAQKGQCWHTITCGNRSMSQSLAARFQYKISGIPTRPLRTLSCTF